MQRNPTKVEFTVTLEFSKGRNVTGSIIFEELITPEDFTSNYSELCREQENINNPKVRSFPAPSCKIIVTGLMSGNAFEKKFNDLNDYREFLSRHMLIKEKSNQFSHR